MIYLILISVLGFLCFFRKLFTSSQSAKYSMIGGCCIIVGDIFAGLHIFARFNTDLEWPLNFVFTLYG